MFGLRYKFNKSQYLLGEFDLGHLNPQVEESYAPEDMDVGAVSNPSKIALLLHICKQKTEAFESEYKHCINKNFYGTEGAQKAFWTLYKACVALCEEVPSPAAEMLKQQALLVGFRFDIEELAMDILHHSEADNAYVGKHKNIIAKFVSKYAQGLAHKDAALVIESQLPEVGDVRRVPAEVHNMKRMIEAVEQALSLDKKPKPSVREEKGNEGDAPKSSLQRLMKNQR